MQIKNVRIITMSTADEISCGWIIFEKGKIISLGNGEAPEYNGEVFDGFGMCLLPGFIDAHTHLGICEDSLGFEGDDCNEESDPVTPHMRALDGINPLDRCFIEAREAGVTTAAVAPGSANAIGGQICAIKTIGKRVDRMLVSSEFPIKFALGENPKSTYHAKNAAPNTRMATAALIRETLTKAKNYLNDIDKADTNEDVDPPEYDIKLEALIPLIRREVSAHFHAHRADDICTALRIAEEFNLKFVIVHCTEGHIISEELSGTDVILGPNLCDRCKPELKNQTFDNPALLIKSGANVALTTDHPVTPLNYLWLCAAIASKHGITKKEALKMITINPAKILGIDSRVGSIEVGKDADFVLVEGDYLSIDSEIKATFINGEKV